MEVKHDSTKSEILINLCDTFPKIETVTTDSTTEKRFDDTKWKTKKGRDYPHRSGLYKDLIHNPEFRRLKKDKVLDSLGEPDRIDGNYLFYNISQKRLGAWILGGKTLVIKFTDENSIEWIKIHE